MKVRKSQGKQGGAGQKQNKKNTARRREGESCLRAVIRYDYFAYSMALVSRRTWTLI